MTYPKRQNKRALILGDINHANRYQLPLSPLPEHKSRCAPPSPPDSICFPVWDPYLSLQCKGMFKGYVTHSIIDRVIAGRSKSERTSPEWRMRRKRDRRCFLFILSSARWNFCISFYLFYLKKKKRRKERCEERSDLFWLQHRLSWGKFLDFIKFSHLYITRKYKSSEFVMISIENNEKSMV